MTDKELLEYAANAVGIAKEWDGVGWQWNPLRDDGDAFRLAVNLGIDIVVMKIKAIYTNEEICQSTRRYIVTAAAQIGKGMK